MPSTCTPGRSSSSATNSICWIIKTMAGAYLGTFDTHAAAIKHIDHRQAQPAIFPEWLCDLRIIRSEMRSSLGGDHG